MKYYDVNIDKLGCWSNVEADTPVNAIKTILKSKGLKGTIKSDAGNSWTLRQPIHGQFQVMRAAVKYRGNESAPRKYTIIVR